MKTGNGLNPYSPPHQALSDPSPSRLPKRNILAEAAQAFATVLGIMIGWTFIGYAQLSRSYWTALVGVAIIAAACLIGLGGRVVRRPSSKTPRGDERSMAGPDADVI